MKEAPSKFETAPSRESRLEHVAFTMTIAVTGHQDLKVYLLNWPIEHATETWFRGCRTGITDERYDNAKGRNCRWGTWTTG